jgi:alpha-tubulin suppressor-like RCC1 family protein
MPVTYQYTQYSGIWTMQQVNSAISAGTWPVAYNNNKALYTWGYNLGAGGLGLGNRTNYSSPKQVGSLTDWLTLPYSSMASYWTGAIKTDGTLWMWGNNDNGQLGLGNVTNYSSPKQVGSLTTWSKISTGYKAAIAIKTDGTLWTWGQNQYGQLGLGNTTYYSSPKQVGSLTSWLNISAGYYHVLAVKTNGTLWAWGYNAFGQLGDGTVTQRNSPVQIGALTDWLQASASGYFSHTAKTDGTLWTWGRNTNGQLGLGTTGSGTYKSSPTQVGSLTTWKKIHGGVNFVIAVKTDGTLWTWGQNGNGQLGLGNTTAYSSPMQVGSLTSWDTPVSGTYCNGVIKTNGTLWVWGNNFYGQLGLGNRTEYSSPMQVGSLTTWTNLLIYNISTMALSTT